MRHVLLGVATVCLLLTSVQPGLARCDSVGEEAAVAAARAQLDADCPCASAAHHGGYVHCATVVARQRVRNGLLPASCKGRVIRCAARSTCGKREFVTCCRVTAAGATTCRIEPLRPAFAQRGSSCRPPKGGSACVGNATSCCDACAASGCGGTTTTSGASTTTFTTTTTTTVPGICRLDEASGRCIGTCPLSGEGCVIAAAGGCTCTTAVCRQCFLTIGANICVGRLCSATERCALPNEYCDVGDCPSVECPCCPVCGDGSCTGDESPCSCPADCGAGTCNPGPATCGDFLCDTFATPGERHETCAQDCPFACRICPP